jgi:hypothetical protein
MQACADGWSFQFGVVQLRVEIVNDGFGCSALGQQVTMFRPLYGTAGGRRMLSRRVQSLPRTANSTPGESRTNLGLLTTWALNQ